ncbi:hypothetical protein VR010_03955 [Actinomycetaceae bacterium L2_0104]
MNIYGRDQEPNFLQATSIYHPSTIERSLKHDGSGTEPGIKDNNGNWDLRPHKGRVMLVDVDVLSVWNSLLDRSDTPVEETSMVYSVNQSSFSVLEKLGKARRISTLIPRISHGWDENKAFQEGRFEKRWGVPESWDSVILQGPHFYVGTPFYKYPNKTMKNHLDWTPVDLESLKPDEIPITKYKPVGDRQSYDAQYTNWGDLDNPDPARSHYRVAWRSMAANTGERTLIPILIPKGTAHVDGVSSMGLAPTQNRELILCCAFLGSIVSDYLIRAVPKSTIRLPAISRLPYFDVEPLSSAVLIRALRLNCTTSVYGGLWEQIVKNDLKSVQPWDWAGGLEYSGRASLNSFSLSWNPEVPLKRASDRRQAMLEIDVLTAMGLGITAEELCTVYRTQFPVLQAYDAHENVYDSNGRLVPSAIQSRWRSLGRTQCGNLFPASERQETCRLSRRLYRYDLPFLLLDREVEIRHAYRVFQDRLAQ